MSAMSECDRVRIIREAPNCGCLLKLGDLMLGSVHSVYREFSLE